MNAIELSLNTMQEAEINYFCECVKTNTRITKSNNEIVKDVLLAIVNAYITYQHGAALDGEEFIESLKGFIESYV